MHIGSIFGDASIFWDAQPLSEAFCSVEQAGAISYFVLKVESLDFLFRNFLIVRRAVLWLRSQVQLEPEEQRDTERRAPGIRSYLQEAEKG